MPEPDPISHASAVWDASADRYVEFVGTELSAATEGPVDRALLAAFVDLSASRPGARVADIGCGPGRVAAFLARSGLWVLGVDPSTELLARARLAHPEIAFEEGRLDDLLIVDASLTGAVCWYSIINTPPAGLDRCLVELHRVLELDGHLLLAFQSGGGEADHRPDAYGTGLPLTSYRHGVADVTRRLETAGFDVHATTERAPEFDHETTAQAFVLARRRYAMGVRVAWSEPSFRTHRLATSCKRLVENAQRPWTEPVQGEQLTLAVIWVPQPPARRRERRADHDPPA